MIKYFKTFYALLSRDLFILKRELPTLLINGAILVVIEVLLFGYLLPIMGMPAELASSIYLGCIVFTLLIFGYGFGLTYSLDASSHNYISYQLTLPLPKQLLFTEYVIFFIIQGIALSLPLVTLGVLLLGDRFVRYETHWFAFIPFYLIMLLFLALFFLSFALTTSFEWYTKNIWARAISPLTTLGALFYVWKPLYKFNAFLGTLILFNPLTYVSEGLRATLLGSTHFLAMIPCFGMTGLSCVVLGMLLIKGIKYRLDPV
jgi:ABC-2 type transport system permease protein